MKRERSLKGFYGESLVNARTGHFIRAATWGEVVDAAFAVGGRIVIDGVECVVR